MKRCRFNYKNYYKDNLKWKEDGFKDMKHKKFWCRIEQIRMFFRWNFTYAKWYVMINKHNVSWIKSSPKRPIHGTAKLEEKLKRREHIRKKFAYFTNNLLLRPLFLLLIPVAYALVAVGVALILPVIPILLITADLKINDGMTISWLRKKNKVK